MKESETFVEPGRFAAISAAVLLALVFVAPASAQNTRPTPRATPFVPEIVSRDSDLEDQIRSQTDPQNAAPEEAASDPRQNTAVPPFELGGITEAQQKKLLFYLDMLTRLEQRAETFRSQLISMTEKQNGVTTKIQQVDYNLRPEVIAGVTALSGSFRPEDLRDQRKSELEIEKRNLEALQTQLEFNIATLEDNLRRADLMAESVRVAFEAMLESALSNAISLQ